MANDHDLEHLGSQFALEIDGVELARFTGCSGLSYTTEVVEYQDSLAGKPGTVESLPDPAEPGFEQYVAVRSGQIVLAPLP